jgi:probable HAF family extracellular repeat protein
VGTSDYADPVLGTVSHAFVYSQSGISDLGTLGGSQSQGNGVNPAGVVVGSSNVPFDTATHAFWWDPNSKTMKDLGTLGGTNSAAYGINGRNWAAGTADTGDLDGSGFPISHAVIWDIKNNAKTDLGTLGGSVAQANAINNFGVAVGFSANPLQATHAFIYQNGHMVDIGTLGGSYAQANAINNLGIVVGFSNTTGDTDVHAFLWTRRTGMLDLNNLLPANSGWVLNVANGINGRGENCRHRHHQQRGGACFRMGPFCPVRH